MKKRKRYYIIFITFLIMHAGASAQNATDSVYTIDASLDLSSPYSKNNHNSVTLRNAELTIVVVNNQVYKAALLSHLQAQLLKEEKGIKTINTSYDKKQIARYTSDKSITQLVKIKAKRKLARNIKKKYAQFLIN